MLLMIAAAAVTGPASAGVVGGWSATAPLLRVAVSGRTYESLPLAPRDPGRAERGRMAAVRWHYRLPPGAALRAWLCAAGHCVPASEQRGQTMAFTGLAATTPLHFRFVLTPGQQKAVVVEGMQVIVNYTEADGQDDIPVSIE